MVRLGNAGSECREHTQITEFILEDPIDAEIIVIGMIDSYTCEPRHGDMWEDGEGKGERGGEKKKRR